MLTRLFVLALAASSAVLGSPTQLVVGGEAELAEKWSYSDCGKRISLDLIDAEPELIQRPAPVPGNPADIIQLHSLQVSPDAPKPGENLTITVSGTVLQRIEVRKFLLHVNARSTHRPCITNVQEGAWAHVIVKLGLIKLLEKNFDLCEEA